MAFKSTPVIGKPPVALAVGKSAPPTKSTQGRTTKKQSPAFVQGQGTKKVKPQRG